MNNLLGALEYLRLQKTYFSLIQTQCSREKRETGKKLYFPKCQSVNIQCSLYHPSLPPASAISLHSMACKHVLLVCQ